MFVVESVNCGLSSPFSEINVHHLLTHRVLLMCTIDMVSIQDDWIDARVYQGDICYNRRRISVNLKATKPASK